MDCGSRLALLDRERFAVGKPGAGRLARIFRSSWVARATRPCRRATGPAERHLRLWANALPHDDTLSNQVPVGESPTGTGESPVLPSDIGCVYEISGLAPKPRRGRHRRTQRGTDFARWFAPKPGLLRLRRAAAPNNPSNPPGIPTGSLDIRSNRLPFRTGSPSRSCILKPALTPCKPAFAALCRAPLRFVFAQTGPGAIEAHTSEMQPKTKANGGQNQG
jgi:hypothetical protein